MEDANELSRTGLDSHANMPVIGRNAYILSKIDETVDVAPFTLDYKPVNVELVDAALKYECPYSGEVKILIIRRGLYEDVYVLTPTTWNPHSDAYVINEESMLDWEGNMKQKKDHEKRVVLEDIPSDDTMISSLALCEKEQMAVSSYFVDQDEDINAAHGFEDEHQLYQALNMRNEHGQFAMNIGATSILDQPYLDDDDDSQDSSDDDDTSQDNSDDHFD